MAIKRILLTACVVLLAVALISIANSCSFENSVRNSDRSRAEILVSAASDLRFAFAELGEAFERETGTRARFNFGSSGHLAQQISQGAPVDVFASANVEFVDQLAVRGLIASDTVALYGRGFIVLWRREESPIRIEGVEDLLAPEVRRISIANPAHAPYGLAARQALLRAGLWERLQSKLVLAENVNQALQFAQTGNVEIGVIALSLAIATPEGRYLPVPEELYDPIDQALGVVASTRHSAEARGFVEFVNGPIGRPVMQRYGFAIPEERR